MTQPGISFILTDGYNVDFHNVLPNGSLGDMILKESHQADLDSDHMCCIVIELATDANGMPFIKDANLVTTEQIAADRKEQEQA
jgi:hypothetical protein